MSPKKITEIFWALGHPNILAIHPTTLMFTKDKHVSKNGDCIVAVAANKSLLDLTKEFKETLRRPNTRLTIIIEVENLEEQIKAIGSSSLILNHPTDFVVRKSGYICNRTLAICADKASSDLSRELIKKIENPKQKIKIILTVQD